MNKKRISAFYYLFLILCSLLTLLSGCAGDKDNQQSPVSNDSLKEHMIAVNKIMVDNESSRIAEFIKRHQWKMDSTRTGVHYWVYAKGNGTAPKRNDKIKINYKLFLLDGTSAYQSEKGKPLEFTLGRGENITGLEETLLLMHTGEKAWVIVPKYLGYGMTGDGKKIPGNSTLLYDVELVSVN